MNTALIVCLYLLLGWSAFAAVYYGLFRPVLLARMRFRIFACRDDLRALVIENRITEKDGAYLILERGCNNAIGLLNRLNLLDVLFFKSTPAIDARVKKDMDIIESAAPEVRKIHNQITHAVMGSIFMNSPGLFPVLAVCGLLGACYYWFTRAKALINRSTMNTWGLLYEGPADGAACAA